jgi:hypothetical protein
MFEEYLKRYSRSIWRFVQEGFEGAFEEHLKKHLKRCLWA